MRFLVQDLEGLLLKAARVMHDLVVASVAGAWPNGRSGSPIIAVKSPIMSTALVPQVLKLPQLLQRHGEAEMNIRRGGIDPQLHIQRPLQLKFFKEIFLANDLGGALF